MRDKKAAEPLIQSLEDQDIDVRRNAADALGKIGDETAVLPLREALSDDSEDVRVTAREALERIEKEDEVHILKKSNNYSGSPMVIELAYQDLSSSNLVLANLITLVNRNTGTLCASKKH